MTEAKHTPGPWERGFKDNQTIYEAGTGNRVAVAQCNDKRWEANARLIAAAPDLLDMLKAALARVELANAEGNPILSAWAIDAIAVIAKAEGR